MFMQRWKQFSGQWFAEFSTGISKPFLYMPCIRLFSMNWVLSAMLKEVIYDSCLGYTGHCGYHLVPLVLEKQTIDSCLRRYDTANSVNTETEPILWNPCFFKARGHIGFLSIFGLTLWVVGGALAPVWTSTPLISIVASFCCLFWL